MGNIADNIEINSIKDKCMTAVNASKRIYELSFNMAKQFSGRATGGSGSAKKTSAPKVQ